MLRTPSRKELWDRLPSVGKQVAGNLLRMIPPRILLGKNFREHTRLCEEAQWWSHERALDYQLEALRKLLSLAYRTPFYRGQMDQAGLTPEGLTSVDDLARLPLLDKATIRANMQDMCTVPTGDGGSEDFVTTGGTGGQPFGFYIDADRSGAEYAHLVSSWGRAGYRLGTHMAVLRGRIVPSRSGSLRHEYDPLLRHHYYSTFHMTDEDLGRTLAHLRTIGPCFLHVYPSSVAALARYIRRTGAPRPVNVQGIIAESEILYPEQRAMVEETFGVRVFSGYGQTEKVVCAAECEQTKGLYHVWPTYGVFELVDEQGRAVREPGKRGEIVGTGFINTVLPFVRYRTGDRATYVGDRCEACGRRQTVITCIEGHRTQESLVTRDRTRISITAINMHDDTFDRVRQYQFRQETPGKATLLVVPAPGFSDGDVERIRRNLGKKLEGRVAIEVQAVDAIALTHVGKSTYVDQRIPEESGEHPTPAPVTSALSAAAGADGPTPRGESPR